MSGLTTQIEVSSIVLVEHRGRDIGHVASRITFTSQENPEVFNLVFFLKLFEELDEIGSEVLFASSSRRAVGESHSNRLIDPGRRSVYVYPGTYRFFTIHLP